MAGDCDIPSIVKELDAGNGSELSWMDVCWDRAVRANPKFDALTKGSSDPKDMTDENQRKLLGEVVHEKGDWLESIKDLQSRDALCKLETKNVIFHGRSEVFVATDVSGPKCKK